MSEKDFRMELKRIFTGYKRLTPEVERDLLSLGIRVLRHRNHIVLGVPCGGGVRSVPISSTGGDKRGGLNMMTKIMRCV